ncbi:MAG: tagaturonate reductase [Clostridia bacterium]|nr:tagaturonate reductase [Clostridia bacterium]
MTFDKVVRPERIIQFGEGGFLRGFADWMIQKLNDSGKYCGNIVVVQPIKNGMCDLLSAQNCGYTHIIRGAEGVEKTIVNSISRCVKPYDDYAEYLKLAENPDFRIIISNTTEAGIAYVANDKFDDAPPKSFPAKLTVLLYERFKAGLGGFVILPCELIEQNGTKLKEIVLKYSGDWGLGTDFESWIQTENHFCNTLVDRINTGYPKDEKIELGYEDKLINTSEYFHLWVIEGEKEAAAELPFEKIGLNVIWTDDLSRYRAEKVRILNGAHTSMVSYALLRGFDTVKSCMDNPEMLAFIKRCIFDEIIPTLDLPEKELTNYAGCVLERFANPYIKHYLSSIALNSVSKFRVRVLPSITEYIKRYGKMPENLIEAFANLIKFYKTDMPNDDEEVMHFMKNSSTKEILASKKLWGEDLSYLYDGVEKYAD